jgi:hypothetical protein
VGRHNGILLTGNDNEIYGHFTCVVMMRRQYVEHAEGHEGIGKLETDFCLSVYLL